MSDAGALSRYLVLVRQLLEARAEAGGDLPAEEEDRRADELDVVWEAMTDAERDASIEPIEEMKGTIG